MINNTKKTSIYLGLLGFLITSPLAFGFTFKASVPEPVGEATVIFNEKTYTLPITQCGVPQSPYRKPSVPITDDGSITNYVISAGNIPKDFPPKGMSFSLVGKKHLFRPSPEEEEELNKNLTKEQLNNLPKLTPLEREQRDKELDATFALLILNFGTKEGYTNPIMEDLAFEDNQLNYAGMIKTSQGELPIEVNIKCNEVTKKSPVERSATKVTGKATISINGNATQLDVHDCGIPNNLKRTVDMPEQDLSIDNYVISAGDFPRPEKPGVEGEFFMMQGGKYINYMVASEEEAKKIIADIKKSGRELPIPIALENFIMTQEEADQRKKEIFAEMMYRTLDGTFYTITVKQPLVFNNKTLYYNGMAKPTYKDNSKGEEVPVEVTVDCKSPE